MASAMLLACIGLAFMAGFVIARAPRRFHEPRMLKLLPKTSLIWPRAPRPTDNLALVVCRCGTTPRDVMQIHKFGEIEPSYMCLHCSRVMSRKAAIAGPIEMPIAGPGVRQSR